MTTFNSDKPNATIGYYTNTSSSDKIPSPNHQSDPSSSSSSSCPPPPSSNLPPKRLHISNIPFKYRENDIRQLFCVSKSVKNLIWWNCK